MRRTMHQLRRALVAAAFAAALGALTVAAQGVTTAGISGRVADPAGVPIADALVQVRHEGTGAVFRVGTDAAGRFQISNLRPGGPYTLEASRIGLQTVRREGLSLSIGQRLVIEIQLDAAAVEVPELAIRVETDPQFDPSRMGVATIVDRATLERLPTISRDFTEFAQLSPLVKVDEEGVSIAGSNVRFNNIQIDGALNQDVFGLSPSGVAGGQARGRVIPFSAIEELQVLVAPYDVRQSGFTGGVLNAVTKSGTNEWRGSAFGFFRDDFLVGDVRIDDMTRPPGTLENLVGGFDIGGPIVRDRVHLFAAAELERRRTPPDGFQVGLDDPVLTKLSPDSVARFAEILSGFGADAGEAGTFTLANDLANVFARLDFQIDEGNSAMIRYNFAAADDDPAPNRLPGDAYELSSNATTLESRNHSVVGQWLSSFGDNFSNDLLINAQFLRDKETPLSRFPRIEIDVSSEIDGGVVRRRLRAGSNFFANASSLDQDILQVSDALTWVRGDHRLTFGGAYERFSIRRLFLPGSLGAYRFGSLEDFEANRPSQYDVSLPLTGGDRSVAFAVNQFAAFIQDEVSIGDALNVRIGVRVDVPTMSNAPSRNGAVADLYGVDTGKLPSGNPLLSPRLGFNLRLGAERGTQIRGGTGLFTGRPPFAWLSNAYQNTGLATAFLTCLDENAPAFSTTAPTTCVDGSGASSAIPVVNAFDPDFTFPQDFKVSLAIDQRLPDGWIASVEGIYSKAVNQVFFRDLNIGAATPASERTPENGFSDGFGFDSRDSFGDGGRSTDLTDPPEPPFFPRRVSESFSQVILGENRSDNFAYAVSARLRKSWGSHFAIDAGYSFNRSADTQSLSSLDATSNFGFTAIEGDPNSPTRQPSLFDRPHKVVLNLSAGFERFGGTRISVLYIGQSGRPYSYVYLGDVNADGYPGNGQALDLTNDLISVSEGVFDFPARGVSGFLFQQLAAAEPCLDSNRLRILSRNACRVPWSNQVDLRVTQDIRVGTANLQVIVDVLNVLNLIDSDWGQVQTVNPVVQLLRVTGRIEDDAVFDDVPEVEDPLQVRYIGPVRRGEEGGFRAVRPFAPDIGPSQWQAQFGVRLSFG